jgi:hypothetical protein
VARAGRSGHAALDARPTPRSVLFIFKAIFFGSVRLLVLPGAHEVHPLHDVLVVLAGYMWLGDFIFVGFSAFVMGHARLCAVLDLAAAAASGQKQTVWMAATMGAMLSSCVIHVMASRTVSEPSHDPLRPGALRDHGSGELPAVLQPDPVLGLEPGSGGEQQGEQDDALACQAGMIAGSVAPTP